MDELKALFTQLITGQISADDRARFYELILQPENDEAFASILKEFREQNASTQTANTQNANNNVYLEADWEPMVQAILQQKALPRKIGAPPRIWFRAAAAIFIGFLALSTYFLLKPKQQSDLTKNQNQKIIDVAPGTNKATLTLGNGHQIILDSAANGLLAKQNNTNIIKTDSGRLTYTTQKQTTTEKPTIEENVLTTPRGGQYQLILPDGTKVWLNSASSITYPTAFTGKNRAVTVTGEAYFEVIHNADMPFTVKVNEQTITDIGTEFNINAYSDESTITTTLISGSIKITSTSKTNSLNNNTTNNTKTNILKPGEQEISSTEGQSISIKENVDLEKVQAWRNGIFEFNNLDFKSIMRQVSRWYDVNVEYKTDPGTVSFGGGISKQLTLLQVLHLLEGSGLHLTLKNKTIFVTK